MPNYKTVFGSYLKVEDLDGREPRVVIHSVELEDVGADNGKPERKLVVHFVGKDKALVLNKTNCEALATITGTEDYEQWAGHTVQLYTDPNVKYQGKTVSGLRIKAASTVAAGPRPIPPPPPPPERIPGSDDITADDIPF